MPSPRPERSWRKKKQENSGAKTALMCTTTKNCKRGMVSQCKMYDGRGERGRSSATGGETGEWIGVVVAENKIPFPVTLPMVV